MILSRKPLTLAEARELSGDLESRKELETYFTTFTKLSKTDAHKLASEIRALNNPKIREEDVVKLVDFLPQDSEDINKILIEVSLSEEEANAILTLVKQY